MGGWVDGGWVDEWMGSIRSLVLGDADGSAPQVFMTEVD
jgi:hypothetical protein